MSADFAALMARQSVATNDSFRSFASPLFHPPLSHTLTCGRCHKKEGKEKKCAHDKNAASTCQRAAHLLRKESYEAKQKKLKFTLSFASPEKECFFYNL
jgi:hypothetical protein